MTSYTNIFGGDPVQPSDFSYEVLTLTVANTALNWPTTFSTVPGITASIIDVNNTFGPTATITMPDASDVSVGKSILFNNVGANPFSVLNNMGNSIVTIQPGISWFVYITDNTTTAGEWGTIQFGAGTSQANASALAGRGLTAYNSHLNVMTSTVSKTTDFSIDESYRGALVVWNGGVGTSTLPVPSGTNLGNGFYFSISNANTGTGSLNIIPSNGALINGESSFTLGIGTTSSFITDGNNWYTLGYGIPLFFNVTANNQALTGIGPIITLSNTQAANLIQHFTGVLTANTTIIFPQTYAQYYIWNDTTGPFTLQVQTAALGSVPIFIAQGEKFSVFCDTINLYNIPSSLGGIRFANGAAAAPSITFQNDPTTGLYYTPLPNATLGFTVGGVEQASLNQAEFNVNTQITTANVVASAQISSPTFVASNQVTTPLLTASTQITTPLLNFSSLGTAATPAIKFSGSTAAIYSNSSNQLNYTFNGTAATIVESSIGINLANANYFQNGIYYPSIMRTYGL